MKPRLSQSRLGEECPEINIPPSNPRPNKGLPKASVILSISNELKPGTDSRIDIELPLLGVGKPLIIMPPSKFVRAPSPVGLTIINVLKPEISVI